MKLSPVAATALALFIASLLCSVLLYDKLPDPVPTHFDASGNANGFTPKPLGAFILPMILAFVGLLFSVIPAISPHGFSIAFPRAYAAIAISILIFVFAAGTLALSEAMGFKFNVVRVIFPAIGALFVVMGNYMGKLTRNFFIGIRTPWTLASDEVWLRTHRVGGPLFVLAGIATIIAGAVQSSQGAEYVLIGAVAGASLFLVAYSYVLYRKIEGHNGSTSPSS